MSLKFEEFFQIMILFYFIYGYHTPRLVLYYCVMKRLFETAEASKSFKSEKKTNAWSYLCYLKNLLYNL